MKLAENLEKYCKERDISISRLAKDLGLPIQTLHGWTEGRQAVNLEHLKKVANYFCIPLYALVFDEQDPHESKREELLRELFSGDVRVTVHKIERHREPI